MADVCRSPALHPENMDATCSDVRELLAPTSFHVVDGGCARRLNVDNALFGQLRSELNWPPLTLTQRGVQHIESRRVRATSPGVPE
jgi:hypothetical protein